MEGQLKQVEAFAAKAHEGQTRKYSADKFIRHPVRVMEMCSNYTDDIEILSAALLHDVLEDTEMTDADMQQFLQTVFNEPVAEHILQLVTELTDVYVKPAYPKWNRRKRKSMELKRLANTSPESQTVKYADIIDNCRKIREQDPEFAKVFLHECARLLKYINKGNSALYELAVQTVDGEINKL